MNDPIDPRVAQANERTLLSWIRTGLALMAFGFVVERLAVWLGTKTNAATLVIGAVIVGLGACCQVLGVVRFLSVKRALLEGRPPPSGGTGPVLLAVFTAIAGVALFVYLLTT